MPRQKRVHAPEYRAEAVQLVLAADKPIAKITRDLGIGESTIRNWVAKGQGKRSRARQAFWMSTNAPN